MTNSYQLGISKTFPCNYLAEQEERLLIAVDERLNNAESYNWLMAQGFRRSGDQVYRPHCINCNACKSLRVIVDEYSPSKSQKRLLKKNQDFTLKVSQNLNDLYYPLFEHYINTIHTDGSMYPANYDQFKSFLSCNLTQQMFIEIRHQNQLISVAVTDVLKDALSAVYTFYNPEYRNQGIGVFSIIQQIETSKQLNKKFLYLGYQIDECQKMNYKNRYFPHQILVDNTWNTVNK